MEKSQNKKWSSFEEMYDDLKNTDRYKDLIKSSLHSSITNLIKEIEKSKNSKDFFDCTCKLSSIFESLTDDSLKEVYRQTNIYVVVLNAVLRNNLLIDAIHKIIKKNKNVSELIKNKQDKDDLIFINTALSLAFFSISINYKSISEQSIEFLRQNTNDLIKNIIIKGNQSDDINFIDICYLLERIAWDNQLHFNQNYESKFPVKLKDDFLFTNLKNSRSFSGIIFISLLIRPAIENRFKKIVKEVEDPKFSISKALDSLFYTSNEINEKINHYYRNASSDISTFFNIFIKSNEKNIIYCLLNFCKDFHFQGRDKKFFEIILDKIKSSDALRQNLTTYLQKNFRAFGNNTADENDQWTNKLFLISIKTLSVLSEIKNANDSKWSVNVAVHELYKWIIDFHEVLNKYYIDDDWDKIKDYISQESEKVEWKSSFFLPIEQEFRDESSDNAISKKILEKILKSIIGMINTDGGILIVGLVENPSQIKRAEIKNHIIYKNNLCFFDINYEFKKYAKTFDHVRLQIIDNLKQMTDNSADNFNSLIDFEPVILRDEKLSISVIKIKISKSERYFYNIKKEGNLLWVSLTKRAKGQNVDVDIRDYISKSS